MKYSEHFSTSETPQTEKISETTQVENSAGGFSWEVSDWTKLDRFLILGAEGGSYYATERAMTIDNCQAALKCLALDGPRVVRTIVEISEKGRAPKNDPAIFILALASGKGNAETRKAAFEALPLVCRTGTHLFQFMDAVKNFRGRGRGLRRAIGDWYTSKDVDALAYQLVKYRQRGGWTHRDVLRLVKPAAGIVPALKWAVGKDTEGRTLPAVIEAFNQAQTSESVDDVVKVIAGCPALPWEAIPSEHLKSPKVWEALLPNLPMTAMIRNLGRMTANGLLTPMSEAVRLVCDQLRNRITIAKARVHPIAVLGALWTYRGGKGIKGSLTWAPDAQIMDALDEAFYLAFGNLLPSNKRTLLALDVSYSMDSGEIASMPGLTPRVASAAMAMVTARVEPNWAACAFSATAQGFGGLHGGGDPGFTPLAISPRQRLDDVIQAMKAIPMGGTDCALPMIWAMNDRIKIDTFIVYTDSETWAGRIHPVQALQEYRRKMGIPAKLIVVGMVANEFSIADPNDGGMLDVVGFDTAAPEIMRDFSMSK